MVQALLKKQKSETRRTSGLDNINEDPGNWEFVRFHDGYAKFWEKHNTLNEVYIKCPYGNPGDILWVRESSFNTEPVQEFPLFAGKPRFLYKADDEYIGDHSWKPSIHMKKEACRLFQLVKQISVERLHDITAASASREGILRSLSGNGRWLYCNYEQGGYIKDPKESYFTLWRKINGTRSYADNPWVWVIKFKQIPKPKNFL